MSELEHPRSIRSFVTRAGRITVAQQRAIAQLWPRYGVEFALARWMWRRSSAVPLPSPSRSALATVIIWRALRPLTRDAIFSASRCIAPVWAG